MEEAEVVLDLVDYGQKNPAIFNVEEPDQGYEVQAVDILANMTTSERHSPLDQPLEHLLGMFPYRNKDKIRRCLEEQAANYRRDDDSLDIQEIIAACTAILLQDEDDNEGNDEDDGNEVELMGGSISSLTRILEVFPDAEDDYANEMLEQHDRDYARAIQYMLEHGYNKKPKRSLLSSSSSSSSSKQYDFADSSWEPTPEYKEQAKRRLQQDFPYVLMDSIKKKLLAHNFHYYHARQELEELIGYKAGTMPNDLTLWLSTNREKLEASQVKLRKLGKSQKPAAIVLDDEVLLHELAWISSEAKKKQEQADEELAKQINQKEAEETGQLFECGCCYSEYPFEDLVQCSEGHLFCCNCLQRYAEETLFGAGKTGLRCMNGSEPCNGEFKDSQLQRALSEKVYSRYVEASTRDAAKAAHLDNLVSCFECGFQAELAPTMKILDCPACGKSTCRECGEEAHIPLRCEEVEKQSQTNQRVKIEEAMTLARIRECPNPQCKARFYKVEGCNKMTCSCGTLMCYLCRKNITREGYKHFCQAPHCDHKSCGSCILFTNTVEDDRMAMREAGLKMQEELKQSKEDEAEAQESTDVDVDKLLEEGNPNAPHPFRAPGPQPPQARRFVVAARYAPPAQPMPFHHYPQPMALPLGAQAHPPLPRPPEMFAPMAAVYQPPPGQAAAVAAYRHHRRGNKRRRR